jgi:acetoin utilization protein AcuB
MRVRDVMKWPVHSVRRSDTMGTALRLMRQQGIRHLLVLDEGKLVGILSDRDLRSPEVPGRWHATPWADSLAVESVMSSPVMVLSPDAALSAAARLMHDERIDCAPVVEDETIVGIITSSDLLQILANEEGSSPVPN